MLFFINIAILVVIAAIAYVMFAMRTRALRDTVSALQREVEERTNELANKMMLLDDMEKKLSELSSKLPDKEENATAERHPFVTKAEKIMESHYQDSDYDLEDFVNDMGNSKPYVNQKLKELTGMTIGQFMKGYRLDRAKAMIEEADDDYNVAEIAYDVGFNDPKYFSKCFKSHFGYLPSRR